MDWCCCRCTWPDALFTLHRMWARRILQGQDRAAELAAELKKLTREQRLELEEFRGDASDDEGERLEDGDVDHALTTGPKGIRGYTPCSKTAGRSLKQELEELEVRACLGIFDSKIKTKTRPVGASSYAASSLGLRDAFVVSPSGAIAPAACGGKDGEGTLASWATGIKLMATALDEAAVARATKASTEDSVLGEPGEYVLKAGVVDLDDVDPSSSGIRVDAQSGRYVPRSVLLPDGGELGEASECAALFREGPTLIEMIVREALNPRQALSTYIVGTDHMRQISDPSSAASTLLIRGGPGTGKSTVARAFLKWLDLNGASQTCIGGCFTGKAACNIGMPTIHRSANLSVRKVGGSRGGSAEAGGVVSAPGDTSKGLTQRDKQLMKVLDPAGSYVHDEASLTSAVLLWDLSTSLNRLRSVDPDTARCFGNLNFVSIGDFYQKVGRSQPMYGSSLCVGEGGPGLDKASLDRINKGRALYRETIRTITLQEQVRAAADPELQHLNRFVRNGRGTEAHRRALNARALDAVDDSEIDRLFDALLAEHDFSPDAQPSAHRSCALGCRHALLDQFDKRLIPMFAAHHGRRVVHMPSEDVVVGRSVKQRYPNKQKEFKVSSRPLGTWLQELLAHHSTVFTASKCGNMASTFLYVDGATYRMWASPPGLSAVGACNGNLATAVGFVPDPREAPEPVGPDGLPETTPWSLAFPPKCILLRLHDQKLLGGRRIGNLPYGIVPWFPRTAVFAVRPEKVNRRWFQLQRMLHHPISDTYQIKRTGFALKPALTGTDYACQGTCQPSETK